MSYSKNDDEATIANVPKSVLKVIITCTSKMKISKMKILKRRIILIEIKQR